jgi:two-component system sensor histidine kinase/response regulator
MPEPQTKPACILIVDDDEDLRSIVQSRLSREGYDVRVAGDAQAAFEQVSAQIPDLILLDVNLPDLSGYEISRRLKTEMFPNVFVPIVFVTGQGELPEKLRGFESGGDDYLVKPFDGDELDARIRSMLKIKRLQDDLREANKKLKSLQDLKDQLTHLLVHDLRLPLSNLLVGAQRLLQKMGHQLTEEEARLWRIVEDSGKILMEMIDNILDVSAMEEGRLPLAKKPLDLKALLQQCLDQVADAAHYRKITCEAAMDGPPSLVADEKMVRRAVVNLLWNALKVSPPASKVVLRSEPGAKAVRIVVEDKGNPIPADQREKIFDQYYQAEVSRQGRTLGIGYGLIYCRLVAESHGGTLTVEPMGKDETRSPAAGGAVEPVEKGNRFVLTFPVTQDAPRRAAG